MNIEISTSGAIAHRGTEYNPSLSSSQPSILLKKENEPWRGSTGFDLTNLLHRNPSASSPAPPLPLPTFNLPSFHSFGKPLITKPDPSFHRSRSILNESSPSTQTIQHASAVEASPPSGGNKVPLLKETPQKIGAASGRRLAPAPLDDEDGEGEGEADAGSATTTTGSIRGGRWSAEEHDRFLAGFRIHGHKWKRVQQVVRTRSVTQVRTHAQKYLLKLAKLNADKKHSEGEGPTTHSSSDTENTQTAGSTPEESSEAHSPRKKAQRSLVTVHIGAVDEEYISAAATTLCFLMRQKIDSLFDSRHEDDEKSLEPYDCYSKESMDSSSEHNIERSRKRPYMEFMNEATTNAPEASTYSIEGKQLCS